MAEPFLKYRTRFTSSLKNELVPLFDQLAKKTRIPKSRLLDEAIEDLLKKYNIEIPTEDTKRSLCKTIFCLFPKNKALDALI